ncbi:MAG: putative nucleotidyltransferase substrate binding domain-containing protein [Pseudomonadota bacterium]
MQHETDHTPTPTPAEGGAGTREFLSLMMAPVRSAYVRPAFYLDGAIDVVSACRELAARGLSHALVRDTRGGAERIGMFTTTDLRDTLLRPEPPAQLALGDIAQFDLVSVSAKAELFEAMLAMIRHRVHRVLVQDGDLILGVLSQLDLMGFVSNHSHLIATQVERATTVEGLGRAASQMDGLIGLLHSGGTRVELIARLVSELNHQVFAKLWSLVASPELVAGSCLVVMGSEGRGEQLLKTDQDNALLLRDDLDPDTATQAAVRFNAALSQLGYPPCPGNIMVTNPAWRQPISRFKREIRGWIYGDAPEGPMRLAIFMDARAVAGDATLLVEASGYARAVLTTSDAFLGRFVSAIEQFGEPTHWWTRLVQSSGRGEAQIDLKKLGTFPIVHGVRALALAHGLAATGTAERLAALTARHDFPADLARDLVDALHFLMTLKLKNQLHQRASVQPPDNLSGFDALGTLDRDALRDSLAIVRRFRQYLRQRFQLDT